MERAEEYGQGETSSVVQIYYQDMDIRSDYVIHIPKQEA